MRAGMLATGALLLASAACTSRQPAPEPTPSGQGVTANGVTLASSTISLPDEAESLPAGPNADLVTARCTACHSAAMILSQPPLPAEQWKAEVTKMREAYHAPVPAGDDAAILAYLTTLKGAQ